MTQLEITYKKSSVGRAERQRRTIKALGLHRLNESVRHDDSPSIRGMIAGVQHLITWREVEEKEPNEAS